MRRVIVCLGFFALACAGMSAGAGAASSSPKAVPGAIYLGKNTELTVDARGVDVTIQKLPVHADCTKAPADEGDYGASGIGPFVIAKDGSFTNVAKGRKPLSDQTVVKGRFSGKEVRGTVVEPALKDEVKGLDCKRYSGSWSAKRKKGTGDDTKPGATYATDDFSKQSSGFDTFNEDAGYAEYLRDDRFRIGTRSASTIASLRDEPETATADISVTTGFTSGSGADGVGLACLGTGIRSYIAGYVSLDGQAHLVRYADGDIVEQADPRALPEGLLRTGAQAQNDLRLVCTPGEDPDTTEVVLSLDGSEVARAVASTGDAGKTGVLVVSESGTTEFTFSDYVVKKPA